MRQGNQRWTIHRESDHTWLLLLVGTTAATLAVTTFVVYYWQNTISPNDDDDDANTKRECNNPNVEWPSSPNNSLEEREKPTATVVQSSNWTATLCENAVVMNHNPFDASIQEVPARDSPPSVSGGVIEETESSSTRNAPRLEISGESVQPPETELKRSSLLHRLPCLDVDSNNKKTKKKKKKDRRLKLSHLQTDQDTDDDDDSSMATVHRIPSPFRFFRRTKKLQQSDLVENGGTKLLQKKRHLPPAC